MLTVFLISLLLEHTLLHVLVEVPGNDFQNTVLMVFCNYLEPISVLGLNQLDDFDVFCEVDNGIFKDNSICWLQLKLIVSIILFVTLFGIFLEETIFEVLAAVDHDEVLVINSRAYDIWILTVKNLQIIDQIFVF